MRNIGRIFRADLKCLRTNVLAGVVVFGLLLTPALYAWFNILGFWDPYSETGNLEVAVANDDEGYQSTLIPTKIKVGEMIVSSLRGDEEFKWVFTDETEAIEGAKSGKYYAVLVIPKDFSADLMTIFSGNVKQAEITYYTNQKINAVAPKVTTEGATALSQEINQRFSKVITEVGLSVVSDLTNYLGGDGVENYGRGLNEQLGELVSGLNLAAEGARNLADLMDSTGAVLVQSSGLLESVEGENSRLGVALDQGAAGMDQERAAVDTAADTASELLSDLEGAINRLEEELGKLGVDPEVENSGLEGAKEEIKGLQEALGALKGRVGEVDDSFGTLKTEVMGIDGKIVDASTKLETAARDLAGNLSATGVSLREMAAQMEESGAKLAAIQTDLSKALESGDLSKVREIIGAHPEELASFLAAPAELTKIPVYGVADNGSAMAPFYTSLAIWVGSIFLVALMETEVGKQRRAELEKEAVKGKKVTPAQLYLGRYLIFWLFALIQATIVCFGDIFFLGVQCDNIGLFMLTGWVSATVFSNIVYTLTLSFSRIGESLAIILVVLQVASAGGIFPVVLSAPIFQAIYPWLPFVYSMNAFEGAIAGVYENQFATSILTLLAFLIPMLILGLILRRPVIKLNDKFVEKMEETGVM